MSEVDLVKMAGNIGEIKGIVHELKGTVKTLDRNNNTGHKGIITQQKITNGNVIENTKFRLETKAQIALFKWLIGALGIGNLATLVSVFFK